MALVTIEGIFMGASLNQSTFDGQQKVSVQIDVYQKNSTLKNKAVSIKSENLEHLALFNNTFVEGTESVRLKCQVNSYRNDTYFKLVDIEQAS